MTDRSSIEIREGASAIMAVAAKLNDMLGDDEQQTCSEYFACRDSAVTAMLEAAGPLPERAAGALRAVIEILVCQIQDESEYDLERFRPEAMMTVEQIRAQRLLMFDRVERDLHKARSNVAQLHG